MRKLCLRILARKSRTKLVPVSYPHFVGHGGKLPYSQYGSIFYKLYFELTSQTSNFYNNRGLEQGSREDPESYLVGARIFVKPYFRTRKN